MIQRITSDYLPTTTLQIEPFGDDGKWQLVVKINGKEDHSSAIYECKADAIEGMNRASADLRHKEKKYYEAFRKKNPVKHMTREEIQDYLMQMNEPRITAFLEGIQTLVFSIMAMAYTMDDAEGVWDASVPKVLKNRVEKASKANQDVLDAVRAEHLLGEDDQGYADMTQDALRLLSVFNVLCNFCRPSHGEEFRLVAVENALMKVLPVEAAQQLRHERVMAAVDLIREDLSSNRKVMKEKES